MGLNHVRFAHGARSSRRAPTSTVPEAIPKVNTSVVPLDRELMTDSVALKIEEHRLVSEESSY
jgi:hypothetical protein